jgi:hypothetical protein
VLHIRLVITAFKWPQGQKDTYNLNNHKNEIKTYVKKDENNYELTKLLVDR